MYSLREQEFIDRINQMTETEMLEITEKRKKSCLIKKESPEFSALYITRFEMMKNLGLLNFDANVENAAELTFDKRDSVLNGGATVTEHQRNNLCKGIMFERLKRRISSKGCYL